ncbi:hypothetical protein Taro_054070 [Colocasia esculenta]|uniref:Uncharacterized protein n=1 Tax=Colocasia esculenta TaxID=4460 RepID=A0A843XMX8_COLES|nr:hypothetical protein [Colocasia esculenta]
MRDSTRASTLTCSAVDSTGPDGLDFSTTGPTGLDSSITGPGGPDSSTAFGPDGLAASSEGLGGRISTSLLGPDGPRLPSGMYMFYHGSVDTPIDGVDTGVKCVDTVHGRVDTRPSFQENQLSNWDSVSTQLVVVSTLDPASRRPFFAQLGYCVDTLSGSVDTLRLKSQLMFYLDTWLPRDTSVDTTWASVDTLSQNSPDGVLGRPLVSTLLELVSTHCPRLSRRLFWELSLVSTLPEIVSTLLDIFALYLKHCVDTT